MLLCNCKCNFPVQRKSGKDYTIGTQHYNRIHRIDPCRWLVLLIWPPCAEYHLSPKTRKTLRIICRNRSGCKSTLLCQHEHNVCACITGLQHVKCTNSVIMPKCQYHSCDHQQQTKTKLTSSYCI